MDKDEENKLSREIVDEVERKIIAKNFIDSFKREMGDIREWRPIGDCPYLNVLKTQKVTECYLDMLKVKNPKCCIINPSTFCKHQLNKKGRFI